MRQYSFSPVLVIRLVISFALLIPFADVHAQIAYVSLEGEIEPETPLSVDQIPFQKAKNGGDIKVIRNPESQIIDSIPYTKNSIHGARKIYKQGQLWQLVPYIDGQIDGTKYLYANNGKLKAETEYQNGRRHGKRKVYFDQKGKGKPKTMIQIPYFMGLVHGPVKDYHSPPNWGLKTRTQYLNGQLHGTLKFYDRRGELTVSVPYEGGNLADSAESFYKDGKVYSRFWYYGVKKNGRHVIYSKKGQVLHVNIWENDQPHGLQKEFNEKEKLIKEERYLHGIKSGIFTKRTKKGLLTYKCYYSEGKINGLATEYWKNGTPHFETTYKDDQKSGLAKEYNESGILIITREYKNDMKNGPETYFFSNGNPFVVVPYTDDQKHGKEKWYNKAGRTLTKNKWKKGVCIGEHEEFYTYGKLKMVYRLNACNTGYRKDGFDGRKYETEQYLIDGKEVTKEEFDRHQPSKDCK